MSDDTGRSEYSIAAVSKLTGVSCHALRVWERRYGYPVPHRSASGHRRFSPEQVEVLRRIVQQMKEGRPIGEVMADLRAGRLEGPSPPGASAGAVPGGANEAGELVDRLLDADLAGADAVYQALAARLRPTDLIARVLEPALVETGERWFRRECQIFQERLVSGFLRGKLTQMLDQARRENAAPRRKALVGTVQGDRHEGGSLILGVLLERAGWRALPLGVDLPVREYQAAVDRWRPDALCVSFVLSRNINKRFQELGRISGVPIVVGGRSILNYQGLARRYGFLPFPGPASQAIAALVAQVEGSQAGPGGA